MEVAVAVAGIIRQQACGLGVWCPEEVGEGQGKEEEEEEEEDEDGVGFPVSTRS